MSGIFRGASISTLHSHSGYSSGGSVINEKTSPGKRSSFSAFCASPGTLQDFTMENSYFSYRSPVVNGQQFQGSVSPIIQGRSVREYDEQLTALRKENFNLKLRMYFIEETLPKLQQNAQAQDGSEAAIKELIDTKVELETLRKELQEKQELLKDAAQAINQMEQIQKDTEIKGQELIEELKDKIQCLELEREMDKANTNNLCENSNSATNNDFLQRLQDMESDLKSCQDKLYEYENKHVEFIELLQQRDETIKEYEEKVKEMVFQNAELLETLENKDNQIEIAERSLRGLRTAFAESNDEKQKLITIVKDYQSTIKKKMKSMRQCENQMRSQQTSLCNVEGALNQRTESTARLLTRLQRMEKFLTNMLQERKLILKQVCCYKDMIENLRRQNAFQKDSIVNNIESDCISELHKNHEEKMNLKYCGDCHNQFELKQEISFKFCKCSKLFNQDKINFHSSYDKIESSGTEAITDKHFQNDKNTNDEAQTRIPVRYTICDDELLESKKFTSSSSLHSNFSAITVLGVPDIHNCFEEIQVDNISSQF